MIGRREARKGDRVDDLPEEGWDRLVVQLADGLPEPNLRTAWNTYRDEIVAACVRDHPGTRPSCWWRWDAPESRRVLAEPEVLADFHGDEVETAFVESEAAFLRRHDLLLDGEAERLTEADFAPEAQTRTPRAWTCAGRYGEKPRRSAALRHLAASQARSTQA